MVNTIEKKCPYCNSINFDKLTLPENQSYIITQVDKSTNPPSFLATQGIPLDLYGCLECGRMVLYCSSLRRNP